jgi:hypothetical protein
MKNLVSIIILTYNQLAYTKKTLESVKKYTNNYELIIVDNNSTDGTVEYLKGLSNIRLIENKENKGFAYGCNQGVNVSSGNYVLFLNSDVIVTENWLDNMLKYFSGNVGIVGPVSNYISGPQLIDFPDIEDENFIQFKAKTIYKNNMGKGFYFPRIVGFCMLVGRKVIDKIGGFDERFGIGNFEDDDFCLRSQIAGFKAIIATDVFIHHYGSKSFSVMKHDELVDLFRKNEKLFIEKWGKNPTQIWVNNEEYKKDVLIYQKTGK